MTRAVRWLAGGVALVLGLLLMVLWAGAANADDPPPPTTGSITVKVDASPDAPQDFAFAGCLGSGCSTFTLDDDTDAALANQAGGSGMAPGTYTITQAAVPNWTLSTLTCTGGGTTTSVPQRLVTIDLTAGADVVCTYTNTSASLTLRENSTPDDAHDFSFTGCLGSGCSTFALDDDADATLSNGASSAGLAPGTYVVTQSADADWALTSISCKSSESVSLGSRRVTITLTAGEQQICTFSNRAPKITINQNVTPDDPHPFHYASCLGSGCGEFTLDKDASTNAPGAIQSGALVAGTYTITQDDVPDWPLTYLTCSTGESVDLAQRRVVITLTAGEQTACTFGNTRASLTLSEDLRPDSPLDVTLHRCNGTDCTEVVLDDDRGPDHPSTTGAVALPPGSYTVTADPVAGYDLASITCTTAESVDLDARQVTVTLAAAEQQSCTFHHAAPLPPLQDVAQVSTGAGGACARLAGGQARCWGNNESGQLGDGSLNPSPVPVEVLAPDGTGPLTDVADISAGFSFGCAALSSGQARCWGFGNQGQLGDGTTAINRTLPVVVSDATGTGPLTGVADVGAGLDFSCALLTNHEARCWGANTSGDLGDGTTTVRTRPVTVSDPTGTGPLTGITQLSVGGGHACALLDTGEARCWGNNTNGRLGDGTTTARSRPVAVTNEAGTGPLTGITQIAASYEHTCALLASGEARCWGSNRDGLLGDGTTTASVRPVVVTNADGSGPLTDITQLGADGAQQMCAVVASGQAYCWGDNQGGLIGDGTTIDPGRPRLVTDSTGNGPLSGVTAVAPGVRQTCARLDSGEARCWGGNYLGSLGNNTIENRLRPVPVVDPSGRAQPFTGATDVSAGASHTCAVRDDGSAWCWGDNQQGQLGDPDRGRTDVPIPVLTPAGDGPLTGVTDVDVGDVHSCAALSSGGARCWGGNASGQLGDGATTASVLPVAVSNPSGTGPLAGVEDVVAGGDHSCALLDDGTAACWGDAAFGHGSRPVIVLDESGSGPLHDIVALSAGDAHTCAVLATGQARCWGSPTALGSGATRGQLLPRVVLDPTGSGPLTGVRSISAGFDQTCAALTNGQARCWGEYPGDGTSARALPVAVPNAADTGPLTDVASIAAGGGRTCAITNSGQGWCWGSLAVGDGVISPDRLRPVALSGVYPGAPLADVSVAAMGGTHSCVLLTSGQLRCWGGNDNGRLGDGNAMDVLPYGASYLDFRLRPRIVVAP